MGIGMKSTPTMQDIANAVGYSKMTVSLALRNSPDLSKTTREHIQKIAREMGYRPNPLISVLMTQRAKGKGDMGKIPLAVVNTFENFKHFMRQEFFQLMMAGIFERADELGFYIETFHLNKTSKIGATQLNKILLSRGIQGVVILPVPEISYTFDLSWDHFSVATLGYTWHGAPIHRAASDQFGNGVCLFEKIHAAGYRRPALLMDEELNGRTNRHFSAAYYLHQKECAGVAEIPIFLRTPKTTKREIEAWIQEHDPDVLVGHGDGGERLIQSSSVLSKRLAYANLNLMPSHYARMVGIDPLPKMIGEQAIDLVVSRIHRNEMGLPKYPRVAMLKGEWHGL